MARGAVHALSRRDKISVAIVYATGMLSFPRGAVVKYGLACDIALGSIGAGSVSDFRFGHILGQESEPIRLSICRRCRRVIDAIDIVRDRSACGVSRKPAV